MTLEVDEDRPVRLALSEGEVIDAQDTRCWGLNVLGLTHATEKCIGAGGSAKAARQSSSGLAAEGEADRRLGREQSGRRLGIGPDPGERLYWKSRGRVHCITPWG